MKSNRPIRVASLLVLASLALTAQVDVKVERKDDVPLKAWSAPPYWQPTRTASQSDPQATPQLQFSANQVSTGALAFIAIAPCRLVDTRGAAAGFNGMSPFSGPSIASGGTLAIPVQSTSEASANTTPAPCGIIPTIAQAYSVNLTVVPHQGGAADYVSLWPLGGAQPFVATLNDPQGGIASNAAIVPAGSPSGGINVFNSGPSAADVILDMNGYYAAPTDLNANTALGGGSLANNTSGSANTAFGYNALLQNTTGFENAAIGDMALAANATASENTAVGFGTLSANVNGANNTATGFLALNVSLGDYNTAYGVAALGSTTNASYNTAVGGLALGFNTTGTNNQAEGYSAMEANTTGSQNSATGTGALKNNTTGSDNIAVGYNAATSVAAGNSKNIHIGSVGVTGDSAVIRIGTEGVQTSAFIGGIFGATSSSGAEVFVNNLGQLGTVNSSRRFKEQITGMGDTSTKLFQLRPVNFFYKPGYDDGSRLLQYGLIAEDVAQVYPEMVTRDADGQIITVKYQMLAPMLLNELQKQNAKVRDLEDRLAALEALLSDAHQPTPLK